MPVVNGLNQQRPVVFAQVIIALEWTVADLPSAFVMADQAAVHLVFHGKACEFIRGDGVDEVLEAAF
ncbi:hypothetical protein D3C81_2131970 [compost metagenome]